MSTEARQIRIEDWKGNTYYPITDSKSTTAGTVTDSDSASKSASGTATYTDGNKVSDSTANGGKAITLSSSSTRQTIFSTYLSNVPFGNVSVGIRMKSSVGTGTNALVEVNTYFVDASSDSLVETLLNSSSISGNMFGTPNEYTTIGVVTNYKGTATGSTYLKVEIIVLPDTGATIYFDQLAVAMEMQATSSVDIHVENTTVVVNN